MIGHPRDQKYKPVMHLLPNSLRWVCTALLSLKKPMAKAMLNFGGILKHIWRWSDIKSPSTISIPRWRHRSFSTSPTSLRIFPYNIYLQYLGTTITWQSYSQRMYDKFYQSYIGPSFSASWQGFPGERAYFVFHRHGIIFPGPSPKVGGFNKIHLSWQFDLSQFLNGDWRSGWRTICCTKHKVIQTESV